MALVRRSTFAMTPVRRSTFAMTLLWRSHEVILAVRGLATRVMLSTWKASRGLVTRVVWLLMTVGLLLGCWVVQ
jgi:hypothetical protein